jgi:tetratricopeptide (TPR) repeat protein
MAKRVVPKDLREADTFQTFSGRMFDYVMKHRNAVVIVLIIICAAFLAAGGLYYYKIRTESAAQRIYAEALGSYRSLTYGGEKDRYAKAIERYTTVRTDYSDTMASRLAAYELGNIYFILNDMEKSIGAYNDFLKETSQDTVLTSLAYNGLGYCYETLKDYPRALEAFKSSINSEKRTVSAALAFGNVARIYEQMKDFQQAEENYRKALDEETDPLTERLIRRKIAIIAYKSDEEREKN